MGKNFGLIFGLLFAFLGNAQNIPALKNPTQAVQDYANLLSESEKQALNQKLTTYADSTSTGIVIAILPSVEDNINFFAAEMLAQWKIGQKGKDNGVLILMAKEQRRVAISTGYGVEPYLTDALSKQIIMQDMIPAFKQGDYFAGFDRATTSIMQVLSGTFQGQPHSDSELPNFFISLFLFMLLVFILLYFLGKGKNGGNSGRSYRDAGPDLSDIIILSRMGRSQGGFGGFSGGGFSGGFGGFGGGMGGGGGASGSW